MHNYLLREPAWLWCSETCTKQRRKEILLESDEIVDDLYYFKDILSVGEPRLSKVVTQDLLNLLVFPILIPLLQLRQSNVSNFLSYLFFVFKFGNFTVNNVMGLRWDWLLSICFKMMAVSTLKEIKWWVLPFEHWLVALDFLIESVQVICFSNNFFYSYILGHGLFLLSYFVWKCLGRYHAISLVGIIYIQTSWSLTFWN